MSSWEGINIKETTRKEAKRKPGSQVSPSDPLHCTTEAGTTVRGSHPMNFGSFPTTGDIYSMSHSTAYAKSYSVVFSLAHNCFFFL